MMMRVLIHGPPVASEIGVGREGDAVPWNEEGESEEGVLHEFKARDEKKKAKQQRKKKYIPSTSLEYTRRLGDESPHPQHPGGPATLALVAPRNPYNTKGQRKS